MTKVLLVVVRYPLSNSTIFSGLVHVARILVGLEYLIYSREKTCSSDSKGYIVQDLDRLELRLICGEEPLSYESSPQSNQ